MTLRQATAYARGDEYDASTWREAEAAFLAAGRCSRCAEDGERGRLGPWQPGNREEYAGRECCSCGEFVKCGDQPEYADGGMEVDACGQCYSDADSGL